MMKVKVRWAGFIGSPGWTNFYFESPDGTFHTEADAVAAADKVATFITAVKVQLPPIVNLTIQPDVEVIAPTTGKLLNVNNAGARAAVSGTAPAQAFAGTTGAVITWRTAGVRNGRRVRGRTFLVPTVSSTFDTDGTMGVTKQTEILNAATALFAPFNGGIQLGVWARPTAPGAEDGDWHPITSASVPDMAAVLRSRRG